MSAADVAAWTRPGAGARRARRGALRRHRRRRHERHRADPAGPRRAGLGQRPPGHPDAAGAARARRPGRRRARRRRTSATPTRWSSPPPSGRTTPSSSAARERGLRVLPRAVALAAVMAGRRSVAVAGTHGKTSTTSMLTVAVQACGVDPSFAIGGDLNESGSNAHAGEGDVFVAEADESDRLLPAARAVRRDRHQRRGRPPRQLRRPRRGRGGLRPVPADRRPGRLRRRLRRRPGRGAAARRCRLRGAAAHLRPRPRTPTCGCSTSTSAPDGTSYTAVLDGARARPGPHPACPGEHMALNSAAALLAGLELGLPADGLVEGLARFGGVHRRFELKGVAAGVRVYDDYAHHPTEVTAQLRAARAVAGGGRLVVAFQPHLYSRTREFAAGFGRGARPGRRGRGHGRLRRARGPGPRRHRRDGRRRRAAAGRPGALRAVLVGRRPGAGRAGPARRPGAHHGRRRRVDGRARGARGAARAARRAEDGGPDGRAAVAVRDRRQTTRDRHRRAPRPAPAGGRARSRPLPQPAPAAAAPAGAAARGRWLALGAGCCSPARAAGWVALGRPAARRPRRAGRRRSARCRPSRCARPPASRTGRRCCGSTSAPPRPGSPRLPQVASVEVTRGWPQQRRHHRGGAGAGRRRRRARPPVAGRRRRRAVRHGHRRPARRRGAARRSTTPGPDDPPPMAALARDRGAARARSASEVAGVAAAPARGRLPHPRRRHGGRVGRPPSSPRRRRGAGRAARPDRLRRARAGRDDRRQHARRRRPALDVGRSMPPDAGPGCPGAEPVLRSTTRQQVPGRLPGRTSRPTSRSATPRSRRSRASCRTSSPRCPGGPTEAAAFFALHDALMDKETPGLSKAERELIVVATSAANDCLYCVIAARSDRRGSGPATRTSPTRSPSTGARRRSRRACTRCSRSPSGSRSTPAEVDRRRSRRRCTEHGLTEDDVWDVGAIVSFFALSNRLAHWAAIPPNEEFFLMGRVPRA